MMLKKLSNAFGPSGCEDEARNLIIKAVKDIVDDYSVDHLGNVICHMKGTARNCKSTKIMAAAHMDEVGFMITHADGDGFLHFATVGGIDSRILPADVVKIGPDRVTGVIIAKPVHMTSGAERGKAIGIDNLVIDIGAGNKEAAEGKCPQGDYAVFDSSYRKFGKGLVSGKAFDDRVGCSMLIDLIERGPYPFDFYPVFTTMEEVGLRGAKVAGYAVEPDIAFVLECTICEDSPKEIERSPVTSLNAGPALSMADRSVIVDRRLVQYAVKRAEKLGIPCQFKQPGIGGTDAGAIHMAREGAPTLPISVPARYIHSPRAVISLADYKKTVDLTEDVIRTIRKVDLKKN